MWKQFFNSLFLSGLTKSFFVSAQFYLRLFTCSYWTVVNSWRNKPMKPVALLKVRITYLLLLLRGCVSGLEPFYSFWVTIFPADVMLVYFSATVMCIYRIYFLFGISSCSFESRMTSFDLFGLTSVLFLSINPVARVCSWTRSYQFLFFWGHVVN